MSESTPLEDRVRVLEELLINEGYVPPMLAAELFRVINRANERIDKGMSINRVIEVVAMAAFAKGYATGASLADAEKEDCGILYSDDISNWVKGEDE